ncbi:MAG: twin-arginine translocase TatA/TatE family subunit [Akkermansia sp.]
MLAFLGSLGTPELIAILVIVFLLFGAKKLPELARGIGKSLGEFKKAKNEFEDELLKPTETPTETKTPEIKAPVENPYTVKTDATLPQEEQKKDAETH